MSELLPPGVEHLADLPFNVFNAIRLGFMFLNFIDEMDNNDRPPRAIWLDHEKLKEHFEAVRRKQREGESEKKIENPVQNEAAKDLLVG